MTAPARALLAVVVAAVAAVPVGCADFTRTDPNELDALRIKGLAYFEEERYPEAAEQFSRLARLAPREPLGPANLAVTELRRQNLGSAARAADAAVRRAPDEPDVRVIAAAVRGEIGRADEGREHLRAALAVDSLHVPALWAAYLLDGEAELLERLLHRSPGNLPARLAAAEAHLENGESDRVLGHLESIEQLLVPGPSEERTVLESARTAGAAGDHEEVLDRIRILHNLLRVDPLYRKGLAELTGRPGVLVEPLRRFRRVPAPRVGVDSSSLPVTFARAFGIERDWTAGIVTDVDGDGDEDLVVGSSSGVTCLVNEDGGLEPWGCTPATPQIRLPVQAADFDADGRPDILVAGPDGVAILRATDDGFEPMVDWTDGPASTALTADFDHDGDLDVLIGRPGSTRLYRQTASGQFEEVGEAAGLAQVTGVRAAAFGDLDIDGDLDLVLATDSALHVLHNRRGGRFQIAETPDLPTGIPLVVELDGDGRLDLLVGTTEAVVTAAGDSTGRFRAPRTIHFAAPSSDSFPRLLAEDLDLDGRLDLIFAPRDGPARILRGVGARGFVESRRALPVKAAGEAPYAGGVLAFDRDGDGDVDLAVPGSDAAVYRNEGGERNHALEVALLALADGSGKVNRLGIGSRIDVWAGGHRQTRVVRGELERFGLGGAAHADVVRVEWTNGVPQNVFEPRTSERLLERQVLKGSCAFLYTWAGEGFEFVTDMMWKSALGMPLGIMAGEIQYAPPLPSLEYVRIPPSMLSPRNGRYEIRITEELWEVAFLDHLELLVVDHPPGVDVFVDEAFGPPTRPNDRLHVVETRRTPERAIDHRGRDVRDELAERDFTFVGGFERGAYQGVTRPHDLTLTLEGAAGRPTRLFLIGWVYPTDASINVRIGQADASAVVRPRLEIPDGSGGWRRLDASIDFPSGKNKMVIVELPDGLPADDPRIRIRTGMEVYWDAVFYSTEEPDVELRQVRLTPETSTLSRRGFSRSYRRGGRYGPHWYDYADVQEGSPWRPLPGAYTRTGDVLSLLLAPDDRYVVFGPGDEIAVSFAAPPRRKNRTRTFFLYSDGFLKDADLNTLAGGRVGPLPHHGQASYPPSTNVPEHLDDMAGRYLTRVVPSARPPERPVPGTGPASRERHDR